MVKYFGPLGLLAPRYKYPGPPSRGPPSGFYSNPCAKEWTDRLRGPFKRSSLEDPRFSDLSVSYKEAGKDGAGLTSYLEYGTIQFRKLQQHTAQIYLKMLLANIGLLVVFRILEFAASVGPNSNLKGPCTTMVNTWASRGLLYLFLGSMYTCHESTGAMGHFRKCCGCTTESKHA